MPDPGPPKQTIEPHLYWAQLLHFYQPPTQTHEVLRRVVDESYRPLLQVLREQPAARLAVNINAVLTEMLVDHGFGDVVAGLRELAEIGRIEFVGSGRFHPILPLLTDGERARSIAENHQANRRLFGESWRPRGFFPPEMCYGPAILPSVVASGHEWLIVSGVACPDGWPLDTVLRVPVSGRTMPVLFRDDGRSNRISFRETGPHQFIDDLERLGGGTTRYVVTAMDAETFGHHIRGWESDFLAATFDLVAERSAGVLGQGASRVEMIKPGDLPGIFPDGPVIEPLPSSWSTSRDDIAGRNPYPLWHAPGNRVHDLQWDYVGHARQILAVAQRYAETPEARRFAALAAERLQPALHSCQFWWASRRPMWDVTLIHRGFLLLDEATMYAMRAVWKGTASETVKREMTWRLAAANETRAQLERELFGEFAP